jgi:APA family basic amino acid/polyamine antiporter
MADGQTGEVKLERTINLAGATALVVGAVVGAGIYIMVADIAALSGTAIWLALLIAMGISLVGVIPLVQLAGALPRDGAGYFFTSRLLGPYIGVVTSFCILLGGGASTCVVAMTLASYVQPFFPMLSPNIVAAALTALFYVIYLFGMRLAMSLQVIMAVQFVLALVLYAILGAINTDLELSTTPPAGTGAFIQAILIWYATCMGFQVVAEMGEEIKNARRNIPLALLLGGAIVAFLYTIVSVIFVSATKQQGMDLDAMIQPLSETAERFMSPNMLFFLNLGAFTAGFTSFNAAAIALPRELFAQARDGMLPPFFSKISPRTHTPQIAVGIYFVFVICMLFTQREKDFYSLTAGIGILVMSSLLCIACLRLPRKYPDRYDSAYIRFPWPLLVACTIITLIASAILMVALATEMPAVLALYAVWILLVSIWYFLRTRHYGRDQWARIESIPGEDES